MNERGICDLNFRVTVELRKCQLGEELTPSGKCQECVAPYYSLVVMNQTGSCQLCPE